MIDDEDEEKDMKIRNKQLQVMEKEDDEEDYMKWVDRIT